MDVKIDEAKITFSIELSVEAILAGIDLANSTNTASSEREDVYDALRQQSSASLSEEFRQHWPKFKNKYWLYFNDVQHELQLNGVDIPDIGNTDLVRLSKIEISGLIPTSATDFQFGWDGSLGLMVLRRSAEEGGFAGYIEPGELSPILRIDAEETASNLSVFLKFIPVGFDHILPKGLDHILFVVGLFLFSARMRPLIWQVSAFTLAHTITLALASLGVVTVSASIVEPLIAISIAYVAIENIFTSKMAPWRPALIFAFGLLHGLGFASVLSEFGLPGAGLIYALVGFNIGVEIGQLVVIGVCFAVVGYWFRDMDWYRSRITIPASGLIALVGLWWTVERTLL